MEVSKIECLGFYVVAVIRMNDDFTQLDKCRRSKCDVVSNSHIINRSYLCVYLTISIIFTTGSGIVFSAAS